MTSLFDLVPTGQLFMALPFDEAAAFIKAVASSKAKQGIFDPADLLTKSQGIGIAHTEVSVYDDVPSIQLSGRIDLVLQQMLMRGEIAPCYTSGPRGHFWVTEAM